MKQQSCPYRIDMAATDIHGENRELREHGAAAPIELPDAVTGWSILDQGLAKRLMMSPDVSKNPRLHWDDYRHGRIPATWPLRAWPDADNALTAEGEDHQRQRRPIASAFSARRVRKLTQDIRRIVDDLLTRLEHHTDEDGVVDFRTHFAWQLPLRVANSLLGVPSHLHDEFRDLVGGIFATNVTGEQAATTRDEMSRLLEELIVYKRQYPGDDITSDLIAAHDDPNGALRSALELLGSFLLLIGAAHETTVNLIHHLVLALLRDRDQLEHIFSGRAIWSDAIEETLGFQAPIANIIPRAAVKDIHDEETGVRIGKGELIVINFAAAGRDPQAMDRPDEFDVTREPKRPHISFGHGVHRCPGETLARLEAEIAVEALLTRFPDIALAEEPQQLTPVASIFGNGHTTLPVRLNVPTTAA
ncbi:cytochrome P450 [Streptomyces sp. NPDC088124]|uniref:cytochrome P450 n=1 Tax=Streptomyces sp. NPDC088124 TaxID=3154654 RepID=UPI00342E2F14